MSNNAGRLTSRLWMAVVFLFLYLPILTLVVLSFNASPIVTQWGGWSLRWYSELANDTEIVSGFVLSLEIAFLTACSSVVLGTLAAMTLHRW
jgi:putrescine transport system permease protein